MKTIKFDDIISALPEHADITMQKHPINGLRFEIVVPHPCLTEKEHADVINKHREIIGVENIAEFYTEETGHHWFIYLKKGNLIEVQI